MRARDAQGRAVLAAEVDHLEVERAPRFGREHPLQVPLGPLDGHPTGETPARREPVDVRVDRELPAAEGLQAHDRGGLVPYAGESLQRLERIGDRAVVVRDQDPRELRDVPALRGGEAAGSDDRDDVRDRKLGHLERRRRLGEQLGSDPVDPLVRALRGEHHGDQQGERVPVPQRNRRRRVELVEDRLDASGLLRARHPAQHSGSRGRPGSRVSMRGFQPRPALPGPEHYFPG
jgi:hypothetical protein